MGVKSSTEDFVKRSVSLHGNTYDYSLVTYQGALTKVTLVCKSHGDFEITPNRHIRGAGCPSCGRIERRKALTSNTDRFVNEASALHDNFYDYSRVKYLNAKTPVRIICPIHGIFEQRPNNHVNKKQGCRTCNANAGFLNTTIIERQKKKYLQEECWLYFVYLPELGKDVYKIGLSTDLSKRLKHLSSTSKSQVSIVSTIQSNTYSTFYKEKSLHRLLKGKRYNGESFAGYTECFYLDSEDLEFIDLVFKELEDPMIKQRIYNNAF